MALIAWHRSAAHVKVLQIRFPVWSALPGEFNVKTGCRICRMARLSCGWFMGKDGSIMSSRASMVWPVQMFLAYGTGESGVGFQEHEAIFAEGLKMFLRPRRCSDRPAGLCHAFNRTLSEALPLTLIKTLRYFFKYQILAKPKVR